MANETIFPTLSADEQTIENYNQKIKLLHYSNQCSLLAFIAMAFDDWFTAKDVFDKYDQFSVIEIKEVCLVATRSGFFNTVSVGNEYKYKKKFTFLK